MVELAFFGEFKPMCESRQRQPILSSQALAGLQQAKRQILDAVAGRMSEQLIAATTQAAVRLARREPVTAETISKRALALARETLKDLAQRQWKADTALLLHKRLVETGRVQQALRRAGMPECPE
jgi:hypothetical protein